MLNRNERLKLGFSTIGELAKAAGVPVSTIRHYTDIGLLKIEAKTPAGYRLYNKQLSLKVIYKIRPPFERRRSLQEIKNSLKKIKRQYRTKREHESFD